MSAEHVALDVIDVSNLDRQLLLLARGLVRIGDRYEYQLGQKFLCGRDGRHWFVATVREDYILEIMQGELIRMSPAVHTVAEARASLKPRRVIEYEDAWRRGRFRGRPGAGRVRRQGEWFFIPRPDLLIRRRTASRRGRLARSRGRPHVVDYLAGDARNLSQRPWHTVYVAGAVRHPDHRTLHLGCWHEVAMSAERWADGTYRALSSD
ncbi:MAG: hypothetical protein ACT4QD_11430 [Acidobacteriota bacterium]